MTRISVLKLLPLLLLLTPAALAQGPSTYVHIITSPKFQYQSDQDIRIPFQAELVRQNVPQEDAVRIQVEGRAGASFQVLNAGDLAAGVRAFPSRNELHFGTLNPGLYQVTVTGTAGGVTKTVALDFSVVLPPIPYHAALKGAGGKDAVFLFTPDVPSPARTFTIRVYRDGDGSRIILNEVRVTNATEVSVPYTPGEPTKVDVEDPNHWLNQANAYSGTAWSWYPDYGQLQNVQDDSVGRYVAIGFVVLAAGAALTGVLFVYARRIRGGEPLGP